MMCYARGNAYLQLKEIDKAKSCFKEALRVDVKCYDVSPINALQRRFKKFMQRQFLGPRCVDPIQHAGRKKW